MKNSIIIPFIIGIIALAGCASAPPSSGIAVQRGMSRDDIRRYFGEPVRVEQTATGGEDWYYRFRTWASTPTSDPSQVSIGQNATVSGNLAISRETEERPIHIAPDGYVVEPVPEGKILKN